MLGYDCPCCGEMIAQARPHEMRDCPACKAPVAKQKLVRAERKPF